MVNDRAVSKSESAAVHIAAVANVDRLFERATLDRSHGDRGNDANIVAIHRFVANFRMGDSDYRTTITAKELSNAESNRIYSVEAVSVAPAAGVGSRSEVTRTPNVAGAQGAIPHAAGAEANLADRARSGNLAPPEAPATLHPEGGGGNMGDAADVGKVAPAAVESPVTDASGQTVIPGAEKAPDAKLAQRGADRPLRPTAPQKDTDGLGLFNDDAKQRDLLAAPVKERPAADQTQPTKGAPDAATNPTIAERAKAFRKIANSREFRSARAAFAESTGRQWNVPHAESDAAREFLAGHDDAKADRLARAQPKAGAAGGFDPINPYRQGYVFGKEGRLEWAEARASNNDDFNARYSAAGAPSTDQAASQPKPVPHETAAPAPSGEAPWFGTMEKARHHIARRKLSATHEVRQEGRRFVVAPKRAAQPSAPAPAQAPQPSPPRKVATPERAPATPVVPPLPGFGVLGLRAPQPKPAAAPDPSPPATSAVPPPAAPDPFAGNKIFTGDAVAKARARLRSKLGQINVGLDPEVLVDGITIAGAHIEAGARSFAAYARAMIDDLGEKVKPFLLSFYEGVRAWPGFDPAGMSSQAEARAAFEALSTQAAASGETAASSTVDRTGAEGASSPPAREPETQGDGRADQNTTGKQPQPLPPGQDAPGWDSGRLPHQPDGGTRPDARDDDGADGRADQERDRPDRRAKGGASGRRPVRGRGTDSARDAQPVAAARAEAAKLVADRAAKNFRIPNDFSLPVGAKARVNANLDAIETLRALEKSGTDPTVEQREQMARYVGWGAFAQPMFSDNPTHQRDWREQRTRLRDLASQEEIAAIRRSTLNAHFTSMDVVDAMWSALRRLGFDGGRAIEPAAGIGNFIGRTPGDFAARVAWTATELEPITGGMAKRLYPGADVQVTGFEKLVRPDNYFDVAISNVPFGNFGVGDKRHVGYSIHDYFFLRSLDLLRPGGVVAFVTSAFTLDKVNDRARKAINDRANFIGAIRLPGGAKGAFAGNAGTEVTTDIIFLRKRAPGEAAGDAIPEVGEIRIGSDTARINRYFIDNPAMALGRHALSGTMYAEKSYELAPDASRPLKDQLAEAVNRLPENAMIAAPPRPAADPIVSVDPSSADGVKEGAFFVAGGALFRKVSGVPASASLSGPDADRVQRLVGIRDILNELLAAQAAGRAGDLPALRKKLNAAYDAFAGKHGPISLESEIVTSRLNNDGEPIVIRKMPNFRAFSADPDAYKVMALEVYDSETKTAKKAAIFTTSVIDPRPAPVIAGPSDAVAVSLNQTGQIDMPRIAGLLGVDEDAAIEALGDRVFRMPSGEWMTADQYLSGPVVDRLEEAEAASLTDPEMRRNVEALRRVQPTPLTYEHIVMNLGAPWVPADVYSHFLTDLGFREPKVSYDPMRAQWKVSVAGVPVATESEFSSPRFSAQEAIVHAFNMKTPTIEVKDREGAVDQAQSKSFTDQARAVVAKIRERFSGVAIVDSWAWENAERQNRLEAIYNRQFNATIPTVYDGSHLTLPGLASTIAAGDEVKPFKLMPHQKNAIWRSIVSGNVLLDHVVGAGKTFTMVGIAMERRRLGLSRKPLLAVPNHMLDQFAREFLQAYPGANILVAQKEETSAAERKAFVGKVATGDWDAVIMTHDAFGRIGVSDDIVKEYLAEQIAEYAEALAAARRDAGKKDPTVKELEKAKTRLETQLNELVAKERKDDGATFEEMGVDHILIDELHLFKNLAFVTSFRRIKGIGGTASQRAQDLYLKGRYLDRLSRGRGLTGATGTPISNSVSEMFTMMRFMAEPRLRELGIHRFDAWAKNFGQIVENIELAADGKTLKPSSSFSQFVNVPELMAIYREFGDVQTADMLKLPRPEIRGGAARIVKAEMTQREREIADSLVKRAETLPHDPRIDNMLKIASDGRKLALDGRLIEDMPFNPNGKVARAVENIHRIWQETKKDRLTQIVFLDIGTPKDARARAKANEEGDGESKPADDAQLSIYDDMRNRLVEMGIPREEIAFIHDARDDVQKGRLFKEVREGKRRILFGSTAKMGVGTNVQRKLVALHDIDAPWKPAEVEQRLGRILRQGNENKEIEVLRYVTEGSFDAFMWQTLERKARFIGHLKSGAKGMRIVEEIDNPLPEAAALKAAAAGDPRILEVAQLEGQFRKIDAARSAFFAMQRRQTAMLGKEREYLDNDRRQKKRIEALDGVLSRDTLSGDRFRITVAGKDYDSHEAAAGALDRALGAIRVGGSETQPIGRFGGLDVRAKARSVYLYDRYMNGVSASFDLVGAGETVSLAQPIEFGPADKVGVGLIARLRNAIQGIATPGAFAKLIAAREKAVDDVAALVAKQSAFPKEGEWDQVRRRLGELRGALAPRQEAGQGSATMRSMTMGGAPGRMAASLREELRQSPEGRAALDAGLVRIVDSSTDLPGGQEDGVAGFYDGQRAWLVADAIEPGRAFAVFVHEVGAHHGLKRLIGGELYGRAAETIRKAAEGRGPAGDAAREAIRRAEEDVEARGERDPQILEDETIAYFVEAWAGLPARPLGPLRALFDRIVTAAKTFLSRQLGLTVALTPAQIHIAALGAARRASWATTLEPSDAGLPAGVRAGLFSRRTRGAHVLSSVSGARPWTPLTATTLRERARTAGRKIATVFEDSTIPFKDWARASGAGAETIADVIGGLDRAQHIQRAYETEAQRKFLDPAYEKMAAVAKAQGVHIEELVNLVGYWMTARYAPEVNARLIRSDRAAVARGEMDPAEAAARASDIADPDIAKVTFAGPGVAGGMTDAIANAIELGVEQKIPRADLEAIADHFYDLHGWRVDLDLASGRIDAAQARQFKANRRYVPMTGDPRVEADSERGDVFQRPNRPNAGKDHALRGRRTVADNGIKTSIEAALKTASIASFADFKEALGRLYGEALAAHGSPRALEQAIGLSREQGQKITVRATDSVIIDRSGGHETVYRIADPAIMEALRRTRIEEPNAVIRVLSAPTRIMARAVTQFEPTFAPVNTLRDVWEKTELVRTRQIVDATGRPIDTTAVARAALAYAASPDLWRASSAKAFKGHAGGSLAGLRLEAMIRDGGLSTWGHFLDRSKADMEKQIRRLAGAASGVNAFGKKTMHFVEGYNQGFETISSLSIYSALLDAGVAPKRAAAETLDLMNFGKTGTAMRGIGALFMFARPAAIGAANMARALSTRRGQIRFGAWLAGFTLLYMMLRGAAGDDDEAGNKLDNLSNWTLERSIPVPIGGGLIAKVPVGFGSVMLAWGMAVAGVKRAVGEYDNTEFAGEVAKNVVKHFSPTPPSDVPVTKHPLDFAVKTLTPTILRPLMSVALDRNDFGSKITPLRVNEKALRAEQAGQRTAPIYQEIALELARATGGTVDLFPQQVETIIRGYAVGPAAHALQWTVVNPNRERQGKAVGAPDIPIVRRFVGRENESAIAIKAREAMDDLAPLGRLAASDEKRGRESEFSAFDRRRLELYERQKKLEDRFVAESGAITRRFNQGKTDMAERDGARRALNVRRDRAAANFLHEYRKLEGKPTRLTEDAAQ